MRLAVLSRLILGVALGLAIGFGGFTFIYARGYSYMTNDPAACANCHVMQDHYDAWLKSSHHAVATCNACRTPPGLIAKYVTKGEMDALMDLINDLKAARAAGRSDAELAAPRDFQRRGQFYLDFAEAENSTGFHAPGEAKRILGESIDLSRRGQNALRGQNTVAQMKR